MQIACYVLDCRPMPGETVLDGSADEVGETILLAFFKLFVELRSKHIQKLCIARDEPTISVARPKYDCILSRSGEDGTSEMVLEQLDVAAGLNKLDSQRSDRRATPLRAIVRIHAKQ